MRKAMTISTPSRLIKDSLLRNAPWEEVGCMSARYYKIKLSRTCPFEQLKVHLFRELEQIKFGVPIIRTFHKLE